MKPKEYLQKIGIEITPEVEAELKTSWDVDAVMDGSIDLFMNGYLKWLSLGCPKNMSSDED
jgi:hypothetical protein